MKRRNLLAGLSGIVASGGLAMSTGAFTSTEANRSVTVTVADDEDAYLSLKGVDDRRRATNGQDAERVAIQVPSPQDRVEDDVGDGIGVNSTYRFDDLIEARNQGTNEIELYSQHVDGDLTDLGIYRSDTPGRELLREEPEILDAGAPKIKLGVFISTKGMQTEPQIMEETLQFVARETGE